jgi:hypothetical protein
MNTWVSGVAKALKRYQNIASDVDNVVLPETEGEND